MQYCSSCSYRSITLTQIEKLRKRLFLLLFLFISPFLLILAGHGIATAGYVEDSAVNWSQGWGAWKEGAYEKALAEWSKDGIFTDFTPRPARNYYWRARALDALGRNAEANSLRKLLAEKYPFDYYTFLVFPDGGSAAFSPALYAKMAALFYPTPWKEEVVLACQSTGLPPEILWSVMRRESKFRPRAVSRRGAVGLMQLMPGTAEEVSAKLKTGEKDLYLPQHNIILGATHFASLVKQFSGDIPRSVAAYNAGAACVFRWDMLGVNDWIEWVEEIPYAETREYVRSVLENREVYALITGNRALGRLCEIAAQPLLPLPNRSVAKGAEENGGVR